jgi:mannan polymerase II complex MNN10 subunit
MLVRSLKIPPVFVLLLMLLGFFGWQLCYGPTHEAPVGTALTPAQQNAPRIAIMTFVTDERSYNQISLKNKDREYRRSSLERGRV